MNLEKGSNDYRDATWYFFNPITDDRLPLYVNKMICCSEREKSLYRDGGVDIKDIYVTGAPLQTLHAKQFTDGPIKYDLLVLLSDTIPRCIERQIVCLKYINEHYRDKKTLLRFRPKSAAKDKKILLNILKGIESLQVHPFVKIYVPQKKL